MNLLLDTHNRIWSEVDRKRLGKRARAELSDTGQWAVVISGERLEALALRQKGRIRVEDPIAWVERAADQLPEAPLTAEMVRTGFALSLPRSDPADRFLAATAKVLKLTPVTADQKVLGLGDIASLADR